MPANNEAQFNSRFSLGGRLLAGNGDNGALFPTIPVVDATYYLEADLLTGGYVDDDDIGTEANQGSVSVNWAAGVTKPKFKTGILNGLPVMRFAGVPSEAMLGDATQLNSTYAGASLNTTTMYVVCKADTAISTEGIMGWGDVATNQVALTATSTLLIFDHANNSTGRISGSLPGDWTSTFQLVECFRDGSSREINANNTSVASGSNAAVMSADTRIVQFGKSVLNNLFDGDIAAIAVFNRALTTQERADMHTYFNNKYALY